MSTRGRELTRARYIDALRRLGYKVSNLGTCTVFHRGDIVLKSTGIADIRLCLDIARRLEQDELKGVM